MADCKRLLRYLDDSPPRRAELRWKTGGLGHLGGILESDASAGAAAAVQRTAAATGSLSTRLCGLAPKTRDPSEAVVCPEVDSLVRQLAAGKGEFFDYVDDSHRAGKDEVDCVMCMKTLHETALYEGRHEVKVLPCFHSVCAACLQALAANSVGDAFDCPACGRRTQKMQALHQYLPHFDLLHHIDRQKVAQSDFLCEECVSGDRAETYCEECVMNLCDSCTRQHRRRRASANHKLVKLLKQGEEGAEVRNMHRAQYCAIHRTSRYELYCEDCERLICNECARDDHQQHSYRLPSASLIEKHRQRVKDIIEALCNKLLDDQAVLKVLSQSVESSEIACKQARANISAAFDELGSKAELRCQELLDTISENSREPMAALVKEKERCGTALLDIWSVIDFMEKVNKHGTDVEVLMAKSHFFRDPIVSKFEQWQTLSQDAPPGFERLMGNGTEMLRSLLSSFGSVQVQALRPLDARPRALIAEGKTWADVFDDPEEPMPVPVEQEEEARKQAPRRRRRRRRCQEPVYVEGAELCEPATIEMEPAKVALDEKDPARRRRRRRPRGKGKLQEVD